MPSRSHTFGPFWTPNRTKILSKVGFCLFLQNVSNGSHESCLLRSLELSLEVCRICAPRSLMFGHFDLKSGQNRSKLWLSSILQKCFYWIHNIMGPGPPWAQDTRPNWTKFLRDIYWRLPIFMIRMPYEIPLALDMQLLCPVSKGPMGLKSSLGSDFCHRILIFRSWHIWSHADIQH